jgi:hypothetical protein
VDELNVMNGVGMNGVLSKSAYTTVFEGQPQATEGRVDLTWRLSPPPGISRAGAYQASFAVARGKCPSMSPDSVSASSSRGSSEGTACRTTRSSVCRTFSRSGLARRRPRDPDTDEPRRSINAPDASLGERPHFVTVQQKGGTCECRPFLIRDSSGL